MSDYSIKRGPYGRPWITRDGLPLDWPEGVDKPLNGELYDRPSDISSNLDTKENLAPYRQAQAVLGVIMDNSLAWQFRALASEFGINTWSKAKGEVKALLKQAEAIGGEASKSGVGTALHRLCHLKDIGAEIHYPVPKMSPWLDCYEEAVLSHWEMVDDEVFVVCDDLDNPGAATDLRTAGNFDRLMRARHDMKLPGGGVMPEGSVVVGDIKGGASVNEFAMSPTVQVAIYARSKRYSQQTGVRQQLHPDLNQHWGALIHVPINGPGDPECNVYPLNLDEGWRLAQLSMDITKSRKMRVYKSDRWGQAKIKMEGS